jgi:glycosyltransferase involved in cell wall biosynthesis
MSLYNQAHWVEEAIESLFSQTRQPDKIVIVDDGSTDGGPEKARRVGRDLVQVHQVQRRGVSIVLNTAAQLLDTDYVAILASDDVALPDRLEWQLETIKGTRTNAVFAMPEIIDEASRRMPDEHAPEFFAHPDDDLDPLKRLFLSGNFLCASSAFLDRREFLQCRGFHPGLLHLQDFFLWIKLAGRTQPTVMNETLVQYRRTSYGGNLSSDTNDRRMRAEFSYVYQEFFKNVTDSRFGEAFNDGRSVSRDERELIEIESHLAHPDLLIYQVGVEMLLRALNHREQTIFLNGSELSSWDIFDIVGKSDVDRREHFSQIAERLKHLPPWSIETET